MTVDEFGELVDCGVFDWFVCVAFSIVCCGWLDLWWIAGLVCAWVCVEFAYLRVFVWFVACLFCGVAGSLWLVGLGWLLDLLRCFVGCWGLLDVCVCG